MREFLVYAALRAAVTLFGLLPEPVMRRVGLLGGNFWYLVDPKRRAMARRHMRRLSRPEGAARQMFASYGRYWAESFWARPRRFPALRRTMSTEGLDHLLEVVEGGRGAVVVLPHLGNWEVAALIAQDLGLRLVAVAERLGNPRITRWFTRQRNMFGIDIVLTSERPVRARLEEAIREGKVVALLCDRDLSGRGTKVQFFGEMTTLPAGPVKLAQRTGAAVLPAAIYFENGPGHRAVVRPPIPLEADTPVTDGVQAIATALEELIRVDPGQWHLVQPNWPSDRA